MGLWVEQLQRRGAMEDITIRNAPWNCPGMALQFSASEGNVAGFEFNEFGDATNPKPHENNIPYHSSLGIMVAWGTGCKPELQVRARRAIQQSRRHDWRLANDELANDLQSSPERSQGFE